MADQVAVRIAAAQLSGLSRVRTVVAASPFTGLVKPGGPEHAHYVVAERPGEPVSDLGNSLEVLRAAFPPGPIRFELVDEACPGAVDALLAAGLPTAGRYPLLPRALTELAGVPTPAGLTVRRARATQ